MIKREAAFTPVFHSWLRAHFKEWMTSPYELKQTTTGSISFSCVREQQLNALVACTTDRGFYYKISDESSGFKPFDGVFFRNSPAWIIIKFPGKFEIIEINTYVLEMNRSKRKSLTSQRANEISVKTVSLKKPH